MHNESKSFIESLTRDPVRSPELVRPDWTTGGWRDPKLLWLDKNENTDPELAAVTDRVLAQLPARMLQSYPDSAPLYRKLSAHLGVGIESLMLSHGSDGVIRAVFEAFINPGDGVVLTSPTFAMYGVYSRMYGARVRLLTYEPSLQGPHLAAEQVRAAITEWRPKLVCLPNPDSPTGTVFPPEELLQIVRAAGEAGSAILVDEAYFPFYGHTAVLLVAEFPHLIIARTFAKAWGVAGARVGYAVAHPVVARLLHKVRPMYEVSTLAVALMERLLDFEPEMLASVRRLNLGKAFFLSEMEKLNLRILRGQGNFLHVAFGSAAGAVHSALRDMVLYRQDFMEPCLNGFSRFSATTEEIFHPVVDRIKHALNGQTRGMQ